MAWQTQLQAEAFRATAFLFQPLQATLVTCCFPGAGMFEALLMESRAVPSSVRFLPTHSLLSPPPARFQGSVAAPPGLVHPLPCMGVVGRHGLLQYRPPACHQIQAAGLRVGPKPQNPKTRNPAGPRTARHSAHLVLKMAPPTPDLNRYFQHTWF